MEKIAALIVYKKVTGKISEPSSFNFLEPQPVKKTLQCLVKNSSSCLLLYFMIPTGKKWIVMFFSKYFLKN